MTNVFRPAKGWGPKGQRGALSITFDNFGEAAQLEQGRWDGGAVGSHYTATFLPELIALLGDVKATYFMEASNAAFYPDAINGWAAAGHEVALHGWRHEMWLQCPAERRTVLLADSMAAMHQIGIDLVGFRPPGGGMPPEAWRELADAGIRYCSPAGPQGVGSVDGVISLPFEWRAVDAYMLEGVLGFLRKMFGDPEAPYQVAEWSATLDRMLAQLGEQGEHRTLIFHPEFLALSKDKLGALRQLLDAARERDIWIAPARDVAAFVAAQVDVPVLQAA